MYSKISYCYTGPSPLVPSVATSVHSDDVTLDSARVVLRALLARSDAAHAVAVCVHVAAA